MEEDALQVEALLLSRRYLYELFHKLFGGMPSLELVEALQSDAAVDAVDEFSAHNENLKKQMSFSADESLHAEGVNSNEALLNEIQNEYALLFVGFGDSAVQPMETPYVTNSPVLFSENTLVVRQVYRASGLAAARYPHVADDHIALMCDFSSRASADLLKALGAGDLQRVKDIAIAQAAFVTTHMTNWLPVFVSNQARVPSVTIYPQISEGLFEFATVDGAFMLELAAWAEECMENMNSEGFSSGCAFNYERPDSFSRLENATESVKSLRLVGLEDCELVASGA